MNDRKKLIREIGGLVVATIVLLVFLFVARAYAEGVPACRGFDRGACVISQELNSLPNTKPLQPNFDHYSFPEPLSEGDRLRLLDEMNGLTGYDRN